ncbi:hypothetical protein AWB78_08585 [Caballeronia calidae]|uniref:Uncharacterized protein n=1 Tax=Caballeronia calidae TaxID=1777139 RepID=A0A158EKN7_9BURK|nr:hypothetical protein AWB78_08585 [Caballeronia calidae]
MAPPESVVPAVIDTLPPLVVMGELTLTIPFELKPAASVTFNAPTLDAIGAFTNKLLSARSASVASLPAVLLMLALTVMLPKPPLAPLVTTVTLEPLESAELIEATLIVPVAAVGVQVAPESVSLLVVLAITTSAGSSSQFPAAPPSLPPLVRT